MHGEDSQPYAYCNNLPIMLALCLMLLGTNYAKNYAGIIGLGLTRMPKNYQRRKN